MLLDNIIEELQLTHKIKPGASSAAYNAQSTGRSSIDKLSDVVREKYEQFIWGPSTNDPDLLGDIPDHLTNCASAFHMADFSNDKYSRRERLVSRDDSDYENDTSSADMALASSLLRDGFSPLNTEIIMRATRYRDKFDEMRGPTPYLERTINKALEDIAQNASKPPTEHPILFLDQGRISIPTTPPPPRDYVWQGRMVAGHAYALGGFGGVSKSQAALQLAASIAMGGKFGNTTTKKGSALLIFGEDDHNEITRRLGAYAAHEKLTSGQRNEIEKNIRALGLFCDEIRLTANVNGALVNTGFANSIITAATELAEESGEPIRLIVLDHAGLFHGGDFNAREDVSLTMRIINRIAHETGAAVLLLAHSPKSAGVSEISDASAIAGSTAFVDQTRGAFILATMRPKEAIALGITDDMRHQFVSLVVVKNNYGRTGDASWFERTSPPDWEVGVLVPVDLQPPVKSATPNAAIADRVKQFIADHPGQYSKTALRDKRSGKTGELKASKPEVAAALEDLLAAGRVITREPTPEERKKFDLSQQTKVVLDVSSNYTAGGN